MLSAYNTHGEDMVAWEATRADGPFYCPECHEEVVLKKGTIKEHHFAHLPPSDCTYGVGESGEHREAKRANYEALRTHPDVSQVQVERYLGEVRPDISFLARDEVEVAVEMQFSPLSPQETARQTQIYTAKGLHVLWILPSRETLVEGTKYATSLLERYLHALYFGKVYYWVSDDLVVPIHFEKYSLGLIYRDRYDEEEGQFQSSYAERFSKRSRIPAFSDVVRIADLQAITRKAGQFGPYSLPTARLWA